MTKSTSPTDRTLNRRGRTVVRLVGRQNGTGPQIASSRICNNAPAKNQKRNRRIISTIPICHALIPVTESTSGVQKNASAATYSTNQ